jgi:hypothetical protein
MIDNTQAIVGSNLVELHKYAETNKCAGAKSINNPGCQKKDFGYIQDSFGAIGDFDSEHCIDDCSGNRDATKSILLWGDSHADDFSTIINYYARKQGYKLDVNFVTGLEANIEREGIIPRNKLYDELVNTPNTYEFVFIGMKFSKWRISFVRRAIENSHIDKTKFVLIEDRPNAPGPKFSALNNYKCSNANAKIKKCRIKYSNFTKHNPYLGTDILTTYFPYSKILATHDLFCKVQRRTDWCYVAIGGINVYMNPWHLSEAYALTMKEVMYSRIKKLTKIHI